MKAVITILLTLLLFSCSTKGPSEDDYKIINATFVHLRYPLLRNSPETVSSIIETNFGYDNFIYTDEQIRIGRQEVGSDIYFTEYLVSPQVDSVFHENIRVSELGRARLKDSDFLELAKSFAVKPTYHTKLETELIKNIGFDKLIPVKINQGFSRQDKLPTIKFTYSTIHYNRRKDKAFFYFQYDCRLMCSSAQWVFVEKINGIWTIMETIEHWVA